MAHLLLWGRCRRQQENGEGHEAHVAVHPHVHRRLPRVGAVPCDKGVVVKGFVEMWKEIVWGVGLPCLPTHGLQGTSRTPCSSHVCVVLRQYRMAEWGSPPPPPPPPHDNDLGLAALSIPAVVDFHNRFFTTLRACTTAISQSNVLSLGSGVCDT